MKRLTPKAMPVPDLRAVAEGELCLFSEAAQSRIFAGWMVHEAQAKQMIIAGVKVTPQMVYLAKEHFRSIQSDTISFRGLESSILNANGKQFPNQVCLHPSANPESSVHEISEAFSWRLAAVEAIWSLLHEGAFIPHGNMEAVTVEIGWTDVPSLGGSGTSSTWTFPEISFWVPVQVRRAPSLKGGADQMLVNSEIYLRNLNITGIHEEVITAIREAIKCFRGELFTAAVAMLGKASEGAWLELGKALIEWMPHDHASRIEKQVKVLEDPARSSIQKIEAVKDIYNHRDIFKPLELQSEVTASDLRAVAAWSDAIRDSRNTIHFGVAPALPNSHEKVSTLLIAAVPHMRVLYRLRSAAVAQIFAGDQNPE